MVPLSKQTISKYTGLVGRGIAATLLPLAMKGALVKFFKDRNVGIDKATDWVETDKSIWDALSSEQKAQIKHLSTKIGAMDFLTADWAISALKSDCPLLASLFLGWRKGYNWLARQIEIIKKETSPPAAPLDK